MDEKAIDGVVRLANLGNTTIEAHKSLLEEERERISEEIFALKQRQSMIDLKIKARVDLK